MAKEDDEYPDWLWTLLDKPERKEGMVEGEDIDIKGEFVLVSTFSTCIRDVMGRNRDEGMKEERSQIWEVLSLSG
jgi:hypothetical protein